MAHTKTISILLLATQAALLCVLTPEASAQKKKPRGMPNYKWDKKYTKNIPERMKKAGYVSYGPFVFGDTGTRPMTTDKIEKHLHYAKIKWVETAHFKIGCSLRAWQIPTELETKKKLRAELERLKKKIPQVNPRVKRLDPWLRLHLTAQRMEDLYRDYKKDLGVTDADFKKKWMVGQPFMGDGPYLGMKKKYLVLIVDKGTTYFDYLKNFIGKIQKFGQRWHFKKVGSLFYGVGSDMYSGRLRHDTALHSHLVFNVSINLTDGFRHYSYDLPVWFREALGHYYGRLISPKWNDFDFDEGARVEVRPLWKWKSYTRKLIAMEKITPLAKVQHWRQYSDIQFNDHVAIWSRFDFMMSLGRDKYRKFVFKIKGRIDPKTFLPDQKDLVGALRSAIQEVYGLSIFAFDAKWKEWVLATYPVRE